MLDTHSRNGTYDITFNSEATGSKVVWSQKGDRVFFLSVVRWSLYIPAHQMSLVDPRRVSNAEDVENCSFSFPSPHAPASLTVEKKNLQISIACDPW